MTISTLHHHPLNSNNNIINDEECNNNTDNVKHKKQQQQQHHHRYPSFYFFKKLFLPSTTIFRKRQQPRHHYHHHNHRHIDHQHHPHHADINNRDNNKNSISPAPINNIRRSASTNSKPLHVLVRVSSLRSASSLFFANNKRKKSRNSNDCKGNNIKRSNEYNNELLISSTSSSENSTDSSNVSFPLAFEKNNKKLKTSLSTDQLTASELSHVITIPRCTLDDNSSNTNNNNQHNHIRNRRSILWHDNQLHQRPFSADFTNTLNRHSNSLLQQGCCYMVMDDDLVSEQHEEEAAEKEERKSGENIITDDSAVGEDIGPSHTGSTTAPTTSTMSCLVVEEEQQQQQQSQIFGLFRRFSKFGSSSSDNTSNTPTPPNAPRRATSLLVSTTTTTTTTNNTNNNNNNSTFLSFNSQQQKQQKPTTTKKFDNDEVDNSSTRPVLSRSLSLSNYYRRRFSSLIIHNNTNNSSPNEFGNSMTRARSAFIRSKQDRAVAIWRRSVAQLDLSSAGVISSSLSNSYSPEPISFPITDILQSNTTNHQAIQTFILNELYTTETSYHRLLDLISKKYMKPMITAMKNKDPLLIKKSGDIPILFGHLSQLLKVSQELIHSLEQRIPVEHVFITLQEELTVFLLYAVHYKTYFKTIRKACQTNVLLLSIERECLARRDTNRMGIADYLIAPIQRVPRYCLLLQDLLKHTQSTDPSYNELCTAFKMMTTLASVMNINNV